MKVSTRRVPVNMYQTPKKPHFVGPGLGNRCECGEYGGAGESKYGEYLSEPGRDLEDARSLTTPTRLLSWSGQLQSLC